MKFQGDILNSCDFIQVFVFTSNHHLNGPLRQYFSLYRAVSQREGERRENGYMRVKMSKQPPPAPPASAVGPCPTVIQMVGRPNGCKICWGTKLFDPLDEDKTRKI